MGDLREHLLQVFGLDDFRPAQREVIEAVLNGRDTLCVMPTGAGKSLCYQVPATILGGLSIVVSPLISLMEDQVQQLRDQGIPAMLLNSSLPPGLGRQVLGQLHDGWQGLLYVAPERFAVPTFGPILKKIANTGRVRLLAIDEAHCISQWGHDFRHEYSRLGEVRQMLGMPPTIALTATATQHVRNDIIQQLGLRQPAAFVTGFDRPNLRYESRYVRNTRQKDAELLRLLADERGSGIIYCATRKSVEDLTAKLRRAMPDRPFMPYHAGMQAVARTASQDRFMAAAEGVAIATNAFGMGINKPGVRFVIHYNMPGTLEAYYQEAGRAGRDGRAARGIMLFGYQDRFIQEFFIDKLGEENPDGGGPGLEQRKAYAREKLDLVVQYARAHRCRRQMILDYFGEQRTVEQCACDVCMRGRTALAAARSLDEAPVPDSVCLLVRQLLSAIARLHGRFGIATIADVLAGSSSDRMARWGLQRLSVHGLLRAHSSHRIVAMLHRLIEAGLACQRDPDGVKFRPVVELTPAGVAVMKAQQPPPTMLADLAGHVTALDPRIAPVEPRERSARSHAAVEASEQALTAEQDARFQRLRARRLQLARLRDLPPFCICHDSTLRLIARHAPTDLQSLKQIRGMGPKKIQQYGEALLSAVCGDSSSSADTVGQ